MLSDRFANAAGFVLRNNVRLSAVNAKLKIALLFVADYTAEGKHGASCFGFLFPAFSQRINKISVPQHYAVFCRKAFCLSCKAVVGKHRAFAAFVIAHGRVSFLNRFYAYGPAVTLALNSYPFIAAADDNIRAVIACFPCHAFNGVSVSAQQLGAVVLKLLAAHFVHFVSVGFTLGKMDYKQYKQDNSRRNKSVQH